MQLEQISVFDLPQIVDFNDRLEGGKIYPKIDWLTIVFTDTSIRCVLDYLGQSDYEGEFFSSRYDHNGGLISSFVFTYNQIRIEVPQIVYYRASEEGPFFEQIVPSIRVDLSGKALDFLRSCGIDFYEYRTVVPDLGFIGSYHITRCDWAFDFIDYKPEFLDQLIDFLNNNSLPSGRVPIVSTHQAIKWSYRLGDQKTVYLGSPQSDKLLRIYDKKKQLYNVDLGLWSEDPYNNPESWLRIEWQTRNDFARKLYDPSSEGEFNEYTTVLKQIYNYYAFGQADQKDAYMAKRNPLDFWQQFLPWEEISGKIIQNAKYVLPKALIDRVTTFVEHSAFLNVALYSTFVPSRYEGIKDPLGRFMNEYIRSCDFDRDLYDPSAAKRRNALFSKLEQLQKETGYIIPEGDPGFGFYKICGRLYYHENK